MDDLDDQQLAYVNAMHTYLGINDDNLWAVAVTQHTTACCSMQVVEMTFMKGLLHKYHIPHSGTTETL
jgi:hypothetical protein